MFFQILFIIVICLGIFLCASWFFSCLYTEWQMDAAERARKKQEEELQVVKEQDPDGTEETNFIEETSITIDDTQDKKNKKQQFSDATLPSNQVFVGFNVNDKKNKMTNSQKQQFQQIQQMQQQASTFEMLQQASQMKQHQQQLNNMAMQEQQQIKQIQQRQIEEIKQQYPQLTAQDIRHLTQLQEKQQQAKNKQQAAIQQQLEAHTLNLAQEQQIKQQLIQQSILEQQLAASVAQQKNATINNNVNLAINQAVKDEIPITVVDTAATIEVNNIVEQEIAKTKNSSVVTVEKKEIAEPQPAQRSINNTNKANNNVSNNIPITVESTQPKAQQIVAVEIEANETKAEIVQPVAQPIVQAPVTNQQPILNIISDEDIIKELNLQDKLLYRERKLEEYEFIKTALEIIDLSKNINAEIDAEIEDSYIKQYENAINEADLKRSKINWTLIPILHATDHVTAIEEIAVLLDSFLKSKFFKKINRPDKMQIIDQLLRSVLSIITRQLKYPSKKQDHQEDLLWIWNEIKDQLENEKKRIKASTKSTQAKPSLPPKPSYKPMNV